MAKKPKPYLYRNTPIAAPEFNAHGLARTGTQEQLTGQLQGLPASDLEERMATSFDELRTGYTFRARITSQIAGARRLTRRQANLPGEVEIDLLLDTAPPTPVFIDGEISHFLTFWQRVEDEDKVRIADEFGAAVGWRPSVRVPFVDIHDKAMSDQVARRILDGTYLPSFVG